VISSARADQLSSVLGSAQDLLDRSVSSDTVANRLVGLANNLAEEGLDRSSSSQTRYLALVETLERIAENLR